MHSRPNDLIRKSPEVGETLLQNSKQGMPHGRVSSTSLKRCPARSDHWRFLKYSKFAQDSAISQIGSKSALTESPKASSAVMKADS